MAPTTGVDGRNCARSTHQAAATRQLPVHGCAPRTTHTRASILTRPPGLVSDGGVLVRAGSAGLWTYAPLNALIVEPALPGWLPELNLARPARERMRVSIRFRREWHGKTDLFACWAAA